MNYIHVGDGIFDKMTNQDVIKSIWDSTQIRGADIHQQSAIGVEAVMRESLIMKTLDNITVVMIALSGLKRAMFAKIPKSNTPGLPNVRQSQPLETIQETNYQNASKPSSSHSTNRLKRIVDVGQAEEGRVSDNRGISFHQQNGHSKQLSRHDLTKKGPLSISNREGYNYESSNRGNIEYTSNMNGKMLGK